MSVSPASCWGQTTRPPMPGPFDTHSHDSSAAAGEGAAAPMVQSSSLPDTAVEKQSNSPSFSPGDATEVGREAGSHSPPTFTPAIAAAQHL
ncbi:MAG: hypothetical protein F4Z35_02820 [Dehalococcoidia bacterium]|nr:hypothetical protein [Dehalococcoidia bacterium]